jgi:hypothetical protein
MNYEKESSLKFEFFKKFNYYFLPHYGPDITIEQATQMSKCGGSCGGPYWPVRQSPSEKSLKFEIEAKRIAFKLKADFSVVNQLPYNSPWWKRNKIYLRWLEMKSDHLRRKYRVSHRPALVVTENGKHLTIYDWEDLEMKINNFRIKVM